MRMRHLLALVFVTSCGLPLSDLAPFPCAKDQSCPAGYRCLLDSCQPTCGAGVSCPDNESCTDSGVCMPMCSGSAVCAKGVCTRGGTCQDEVTCVSDNDCSLGKACCGATGFQTCIPTDADPMNCGACGNTCPSDATCSGGSCNCNNTALTACGQLCTDTLTDAANCGACGKACPTLESCVSGKCTCTGPNLMTCSDGGCHDLSNDHADCGTCGNACSNLQICQTGTCVCDPKNLCGSTCVDKANDPSNCGACGHSCQGSTCSNGQCAPVVVASGTQQVRRGIALYGSYLSFTQNGTSASNYTDGSEAVVSSSVKGATISPSLSNLRGPSDMVSGNNGFVYFTIFGTGANDGTVLRCPYQGCNLGMIAIATNRPGPWGITTDGTNVYWTESGTSANNYSDGAIAYCGVNTSCGSSPNVLATGQADPNHLTVRSGVVYWTNSDGTVMSKPIGLGTLSTLVSGRPGPYGITTDGTNLYWAESGTSGKSYSDGNIVSCPLSGCSNSTLKVLATNQADPWRVLLDGSGNLYWNNLGKANVGSNGSVTITLNTGSIMKCATSMCTPTVAASGVDIPYAMTFDASFLYMTTWDGVSKFAR